VKQTNPQTNPDERRRRLMGRVIVTGVLVGGLATGLWVVWAGKRMADLRRARVTGGGAQGR
jgi:hypothetical protein